LSCYLIPRRAGEGEEEADEGVERAGENELQRRNLGGAEMENRKFGTRMCPFKPCVPRGGTREGRTGKGAAETE